MITITISEKQLEEYVLAQKFIDSIFEECEAYEFTEGRAKFTINEKLLCSLFPDETARAIERAEAKYERQKKNV